MAFSDLVEWEITRGCNLACLHCYARPHAPRPGEMDTGAALEAARLLASAGCESLTLSGGEPLLRPDWPAIAEAGAREGMLVQIVTNGTRLDRAGARAAQRAGVSLVLLSLDGMEASHDAIRRQRGCFGSVMRAADALRAESVPLGLVTTVLGPNLDDLEPLSRLAADVGPVVWQVWQGIPQGGGGPWLDRRGARRLARMLPDLASVCPALVPGDTLRRRGCEAGRRVSGLCSDGCIRPCLALQEDAAASPGSSCRAMAHTQRASARGRTAAVAASVLIASVACGPRPADVTSPPPPAADAALEADQPEDRSEPDKAPSDPLPTFAGYEEPECVCVSDKKDAHGKPAIEEPCVCVSHIMCTSTTGMWLCPEGSKPTFPVAEPESE